MSEPYIGQIMMFGGNFAIRGWALCDGQVLPISQYSALFSILGTTYGGDGRTTFALPDMRGRVPTHWGTGPGLQPRSLGQRGGSDSATLTTAQMPNHTHTATTELHADSLPADGSDPTGAFLASPSSTTIYTAALRNTVPMGAGAATTQVAATGGSQPFDLHQPYLCVTFEIAMQGIYPSRS